MKAIYNLITIGLFMLIPSMPQAQSSIETDSMLYMQNNIQADTLTYTVYGMDCPGCAGGLEKQVNKIPSIQYSKADWVKQELTIVLFQDSVLNIKELEKRVKKANFTLETDSADKK